MSYLTFFYNFILLKTKVKEEITVGGEVNCLTTWAIEK